VKRALVALGVWFGALASSEAGEPGPPPGAASPAPGAAALGPDEEDAARQVVTNACTSCHAGLMLEQQRLTPAQWEAVTKKMEGWGAQVEPERHALLVRYLSAQYTVDGPPYVPARIDALAAAKALAPEPDGVYAGGSAERGRALYVEACAACHGADARGGEAAIVLHDRPILYRANDFARIVATGKGRMPSFTLPRQAVADLLAHLRRQKTAD
jgi:cytochrome c5